jgi:hypothetical protein
LPSLQDDWNLVLYTGGDPSNSILAARPYWAASQTYGYDRNGGQNYPSLTIKVRAGLQGNVHTSQVWRYWRSLQAASQVLSENNSRLPAQSTVLFSFLFTLLVLTSPMLLSLVPVVPCHVCATLAVVPWHEGCLGYVVNDSVCLAMQDTGVMVLTSQGPNQLGDVIWSSEDPGGWPLCCTSCVL